MNKAKPIYLVLVPILLLGIAGYFAISGGPGGISPTSTPTASATATFTPAPSSTATLTATTTPTLTATPTETPTATPTETATETTTPTITPEPPKKKQKGNGGLCPDGSKPDPVYGCHGS